MNIKVAVGCYIFNQQDELLLIRMPKWSNLYGVPGGHIEYGETVKQALRREIKEETNLNLGKIEFLFWQEDIFPQEYYKPKCHLIYLIFKSRVKNGKVILNHEATDFRWVSLKQVQKIPLNKPTRKVVKYLLTEKR